MAFSRPSLHIIGDSHVVNGFMRITVTNTTPEILQELGARLRAYRLQQNHSVEEIAATAGLGRNTVARAEAGDNPSLETVIKLLRALGRVDLLDAFLPAPLVSPLQIAELEGRERQRARKPSPPPSRPKSDDA